MKFKAISAKTAISYINQGKLFLPPIQRDFVWKDKRIVNLFDSLYRDYPIGNCIFWKLEPSTYQSYPLFDFVKTYTEKKKRNNTILQVPINLLNGDVHAVVDGQQRLSSLYIGLIGSYEYKTRGGGDSNKTKLYINLLSSESKELEDADSIFSFLNDTESQSINEKNLWFEVGIVYKWKNSDLAKTYVDKILNKRIKNSKKKTLIAKFAFRRDDIIQRLSRLYAMISDKNILYFDIDNQNLDEVVNIFSRVNSGAMVLKPSDLMFSILVSQWNEGRVEVDELIDSMSMNGLKISRDFIMRACLVLSELPVQYKIESFKSSKVKKIRENWILIKDSLLKLCNLLPEIGCNDFPILSENSLIPIAFYIKYGGNINSQTTKIDLQKYLVVSQVKGIFSGQSDQVLTRLRAEIKRQVDNKSNFSFKELANISLPRGKRLKITVSDLEEIVSNTAYPSPHVTLILSLIYPSISFVNTKYHLDHIHPSSRFNKTNLGNCGVFDETIIADWNEKKNLLPNMELLRPVDNQKKLNKPLTEFLKTITSIKYKKSFIQENLLPSNRDLYELRRFDEFYEDRKSKLIAKLKKVLIYI